MISSANGTSGTWNVRNLTEVLGLEIRSICYSTFHNRWVAVFASTVRSDLIWYLDFLTNDIWQAGTISVNPNPLQCLGVAVSPSNGIWIAACQNGGQILILSSSNGISWVRVTSEPQGSWPPASTSVVSSLIS